ncbi:Ppx/GppA phosphatase family protein [Streptomyces radicis]|uniref:Ppx/GppA family phosphatase n=1 Tax=Streptomyces radicis TaxID=1750517 RepID=A0A3A9WEY2_9ACTN|nr:Ppx/GppA family phosphatase [Streptomyces radicis]RKN10863.1 Ppx/GppA family phosphatase [Streptomyces radicis]RKN25127.1 Ppx/GppA family phosphatase [Streptomyces radicis]
MRIAVLDVGANAACLVVAEVDGRVPVVVGTVKYPLRLGELAGPDGWLGEAAVERVVGAVGAGLGEAARRGAGEPFAFATAIVRDAPNAGRVLDEVHRRTGVSLHTLPGEVEGALTFLAVRRWMGAGSTGGRRAGGRGGPLLSLDIGGGTFEVALGRGEAPDLVVSLPLGARPLTRRWLADGDPPSVGAVRELRRHVADALRVLGGRVRAEAPLRAVGTSRTFHQLARLCGGRQLALADLRSATRRLAALSSAERAALPGISAARARQSLAGAIVAESAMRAMGLAAVTLCPWAIREGILLRHIEDGATWWRHPWPLHPDGAGSAGRQRP